MHRHLDVARRSEMPRVAFVWSSVFILGVAAAFGGSPAAAAPCWTPPVHGQIVDSYREPPCPWCAGNRGIEYEVAHGTVVRAAATGIVTFSGLVAGVRYVVVRSANGWRLTYGRVAATSLSAGDAVIAGSRIAIASGEFFFGLRIGEEYADPEPFIGTAVGRPRLIPVDGSLARPAPRPTIRCLR